LLTERAEQLALSSDGSTRELGAGILNETAGVESVVASTDAIPADAPAQPTPFRDYSATGGYAPVPVEPTPTDAPPAETPQPDWRQTLWLNHGCPVAVLYGDDGQMQCSACGIDFKSSSAEHIATRLGARKQQAEAERDLLRHAVDEANKLVVDLRTLLWDAAGANRSRA
jgi:hypothetical protein